MLVIPAIDIKDGRCVRLYQGDYDRATVYAEGPAEVARRWAAEGAEWLHVVDLDGAKAGAPVHFERIADLTRRAGVPVQVGGGIRTLETVERYLSAGVRRLALGTAAVKDLRLQVESCERWPDAVVVSVDARGGQVMVSGWLESTPIAVEALLPQLRHAGVRRLAYTDVLRDGTLTSPNCEAVQALLAQAAMPVLIAGGISALEHIAALKALGAEGVLIGRALYEGRFSLAEAIAHAR